MILSWYHKPNSETQEHAYDAVIQDVAGVVHLASPLDAAFDDPQSMIQPAVQGTISLLKSAVNYGYGSPF